MASQQQAASIKTLTRVRYNSLQDAECPWNGKTGIVVEAVLYKEELFYHVRFRDGTIIEDIRTEELTIVP